ncbi:hypothetical protein P9A48_gp24 [Xanthomonas phage Mallos]|uniref:Uncharacterized protein n=1 Tax=Xanthomonas phage Mallos TaxID=2939131 RepID=A0A9E7E1G2_9CAUD|nr:hypothetical protein P9A48_gp24 [Xanthomonas phage Mallos]URA07132.1 hypothetical protein Mallos_BL60024 [Xanthomonas phage Mallos]
MPAQTRKAIRTKDLSLIWAVRTFGLALHQEKEPCQIGYLGHRLTKLP